jgi:hypothetical protein
MRTAAWRTAGLTIEQLRALPDGPARQAIEDETNRLDEPPYAALTTDECLELLAGLGAFPADNSAGCPPDPRPLRPSANPSSVPSS